jgi:hypothetical protein
MARGASMFFHMVKMMLCVWVAHIAWSRLTARLGMMRALPSEMMGSCMGRGLALCAGGGVDMEWEKGIRWMPWRQEAMKDVARCEKPRGDASDRWSADVRMGKPTPLGYPDLNT